MIPHLQHIRDCNINKALHAISQHFSQSIITPSPYPDIHPDEIFTGRHFRNIIFGLQSLDANVVNENIESVEVLSNLFNNVFKSIFVK
jgi:hypothetical protein